MGQKREECLEDVFANDILFAFITSKCSDSVRILSITQEGPSQHTKRLRTRSVMRKEQKADITNLAKTRKKYIIMQKFHGGKENSAYHPQVSTNKSVFLTSD